MARPTKQGISYFPLDVGFFSDVKIRKIAKACGSTSPSIIICLLCNIYQDEGYYILWDEDLPFAIADVVGVSEGCVKEVLLKAIQVGLFDQDLYDKYRILTSSGIQRRFFNITYQRKETDIIPEYLINHANNPVNCTNNPINHVGNGQSKVKVKRKEIFPSGNTKKDPPDPVTHPGFNPDMVERPLDECKAMVLQDTMWIETSVCMQNHISLDQFRAYLDEFFDTLRGCGESLKSVKDAKSHFYRQLKIKLEKQRKDARNKGVSESDEPKRYGGY